MERNKKLTPFKLCVLQNFPYIEEDFDALTNYGLMCKIVEYLNKTIEQQNITSENVNNFVTWFETLDVQDEIDDKLDRMAQDGTLTNLIKNYINPLFNELQTNVNNSISSMNETLINQNENINVLKQRMDSFSNLQQGSTTGDAELIDGRISYTGRTYANIGSAIRGQEKEFADTLGLTIYNLTDKVAGYNRYDYGSIAKDDTLIVNLVDYTGNPGTFVIYFRETDSSQWETKFTTNDISDIKNKYLTIKADKNYSMVRIYVTYPSNTGLNENIDVLITKKSINSLITDTFDIVQKIDYVEKDSGINIYNLSTKNNLQNYYDFGELENGKSLVYKIEDITGIDPTTFIIYGKPVDGNWSTLYTTSDINVINSLKEKFSIYTATTDYEMIRFFMSYPNGGGLNTNTNMLINRYEEENILNLTLKNKNDINETITNGSNNLFKIFRKVVCCGDSYTAGYIQLAGQQASQFNEYYAWPHYMETLSGNVYKNCGVSGSTCKTWQTTPYGLNKARELGRTQAYLCGWGINDSNTSIDVYLPVGVPGDIGTDRETFYAQYSKVIRELHTISPDAIIFVQTNPDNNITRYNPYNDAIRYIANLYKETYHTHVLDLSNYSDLYNVNSITSDKVSGHYTSIGYEQFAYNLSYIMSEYIKTHISDFQHVYRIPYDN